MLAGATGKKDEARQAWATALALVWLEEHARDTKGEWHLLAVKARDVARSRDGQAAQPEGRGLDAGARLLTAKSG